MDASAVIKLVKPEPETEALREWLGGWPKRAASEILRVELVGFADRAGITRPTAESVLNNIRLLPITSVTIDAACQPFDPPQYALDAVHLAAADELHKRRILSWFVSYDHRQTTAARAMGLPLAAPGLTDSPPAA